MKYRDEEWLRAAYQNHSIAEMADMIDCSTATIHKYMDKYGIERPDKNASKGGKHKNEEWLRKKYVDEKLSQKEISDLTDVHKGTVKYWLDKHDIEVRDKSEAAEIRAERYPNTWGTENIRDYCWIHDADDSALEAFRDHLSEMRTGEEKTRCMAKQGQTTTGGKRTKLRIGSIRLRSGRKRGKRCWSATTTNAKPAGNPKTSTFITSTPLVLAARASTQTIS